MYSIGHIELNGNLLIACASLCLGLTTFIVSQQRAKKQEERLIRRLNDYLVEFFFNSFRLEEGLRRFSTKALIEQHVSMAAFGENLSRSSIRTVDELLAILSTKIQSSSIESEHKMVLLKKINELLILGELIPDPDDDPTTPSAKVNQFSESLFFVSEYFGRCKEWFRLSLDIQLLRILRGDLSNRMPSVQEIKYSLRSAIGVAEEDLLADLEITKREHVEISRVNRSPGRIMVLGVLRFEHHAFEEFALASPKKPVLSREYLPSFSSCIEFQVSNKDICRVNNRSGIRLFKSRIENRKKRGAHDLIRTFYSKLLRRRNLTTDGALNLCQTSRLCPSVLNGGISIDSKIGISLPWVDFGNKVEVAIKGICIGDIGFKLRGNAVIAKPVNDLEESSRVILNMPSTIKSRLSSQSMLRDLSVFKFRVKNIGGIYSTVKKPRTHYLCVYMLLSDESKPNSSPHGQVQLSHALQMRIPIIDSDDDISSGLLSPSHMIASLSDQFEVGIGAVEMKKARLIRDRAFCHESSVMLESETMGAGQPSGIGINDHLSSLQREFNSSHRLN